MIAHALHAHALFKEDNSTTYDHFEEAMHGMTYAASIKLFQRCKDGRGACFALTTQYAGEDKWEAKIKQQDNLLHTQVWKGQSNFPLEHIIAQHWNAFVSMQQCSKNVEYQLPNEHMRVGYLPKVIQCSDAGLQLAMESVTWMMGTQTAQQF